MFAAGKTDGVAAVAANYIEEVFSTWLYTGTGSAQTITNGIDLSGKGGLVWFKSRSAVGNNVNVDTIRGGTNALVTNNTDANSPDTGFHISSFNSNGFSLQGAGSGTNANGTTYASWTFRKQPKFFDVVTYTGNGINGRTVAHSLGSTPGCVIVKKTSGAGQWYFYHRSLTPGYMLALEDTAAQATYGIVTAVSSTNFTLADYSGGNGSGETYVAYLFAHDAGGFGLTGTDNVISCGSFTGGTGGVTVTLGYEPQWVMVKNTDATGLGWYIWDNMRGFPVGTGGKTLNPNSSDAEATTSWISPTATGFVVNPSQIGAIPFIYIAIRRGPMKVPTSGTSVYNAVTWSGNTTTDVATRNIAGIGSPTDLFIGSERDPGFNQNYFYDRLRGTNSVGGLLLVSSTTASEATNSPGYGQYSFAQQDGITLGNYTLNYTGRTYVGWQFKRAPSFFDVVCYTGTGGASQTFTHNLGVAPELVIVKNRSDAAAWESLGTALSASQRQLYLNRTQAGVAVASGHLGWNGTDGAYKAPTSTLVYFGGDSDVGGSGLNYVAYLFATCAGVSKVGSYTGTGSTQTINCGFTGGARFVLIKASSTTGDWYVWDTARGMVAGNDPYLWLNSPYASAEVTNTDWVDTAATGFELSNAGGNLANSNGVSYIFLAIA